MDGVPVVLTGRLAAAAWRLAGARVRVVTDDGAAAFAEARASAPLVLVDAAVAAALPPGSLATARRVGNPPVVVVPSLDGSAAAVPDVVDVVRRALGVAT
jgi:vacuolar-type H+-ATPase subunit F/Vma7